MRTVDYPCLVDATSVHGLKRLAAEHPSDWRAAIWERAQGRFDLMSSKMVTIGEALRRYGDLALCPYPGEPVTRLSHRREQARLVAECLGDVLVSEVGNDDLLQLETWLTKTVRPSTGNVLGNERIKDALGYAREAVPRLRRAASLTPMRVNLGPAPTRPRVEVKPRTQLPAGEFAAAFRGPSAKHVRVAIGLAATANLWEREILSLNAAGLRRRREGFINYVSKDGQPARAYLPRFVIELIEEAFPGLDEMSEDALVYSRRGAPGEPRSSLYRDVARACEQAGVPRRTLGEFRLLYQQIARSRGVVSAVVRGRHVDPGRPVEVPGRTTTVMGECRELAESWRTPEQPPYGKLPPTKVPKKRPRGTGPLEPEVGKKANRPKPGAVSSRASASTLPAAIATRVHTTPPRTSPPARSCSSAATSLPTAARRRHVPSRPSKAPPPLRPSQAPAAPTLAYMADDFPEPVRGPTLIPTIRMPQPVSRESGYIPPLRAADTASTTNATRDQGPEPRSNRPSAKKNRRR